MPNPHQLPAYFCPRKYKYYSFQLLLFFDTKKEKYQIDPIVAKTADNLTNNPSHRSVGRSRISPHLSYPSTKSRHELESPRQYVHIEVNVEKTLKQGPSNFQLLRAPLIQLPEELQLKLHKRNGDHHTL